MLPSAWSTARALRLSALGLLVVFAVSCGGAENSGSSNHDERSLISTGAPEPEMRYLGQTPPGTTAELFTPGIVSTEAVELNSVFSPDGREFFFTRLIDGPDETGEYPGKTRSIMHHMVYENGAWSEARPLRLFADPPHTWTADMADSRDGQFLYFMGPHPVDAEGERSGLDLWVSRKTDDGWSIAEPLPEPVNTTADEPYCSVVADGSLYFTWNRPGEYPEGYFPLFHAQRLADGGFADPVDAWPELSADFGDTSVAPDESYMILSGWLSDEIVPGIWDLYVSFRDSEGDWGGADQSGGRRELRNHILPHGVAGREVPVLLPYEK